MPVEPSVPQASQAVLPDTPASPPGAAPRDPPPSASAALGAQLSWLRAQGGGWVLETRLGEVMGGERRGPPVGPYLDGLVKAGAPASREVRRWLRAQIEALDRALHAERHERLWTQAATPGPLEALHGALLGLRQGLRARVAPVAEYWPELEVRVEDGAVPRARLGPRVEVDDRWVELPLDPERLARVAAGHAPAQEGLLILLLDAALRALVRAEPNPTEQNILRCLLVPAWQRGLDQLDATPRTRPDSVRVQWRLGPGSLQVWRSVLGPRGGRKPEATTVAQLLKDPGALEAGDLSALELLAASGSPCDAPVIQGLAPALWAAVVQRLEGRDLVHAPSGAPMLVKKDSLQIHAVRDEAGLALLPFFAGRIRTHEEGQALDAQAGPAHSAVWLHGEVGEVWVVTLAPAVRRDCAVIRAFGVCVPQADLPEALPAFVRVAHRLGVALDGSLGPRAEASVQFILRIEPLGDTRAEVELRVQLSPELPTFRPAEGPQQLPTLTPSGPGGRIERDGAKELRLAQAHAQALGLPDAGPAKVEAAWLLSRLETARGRGIEVQWPKQWKVRPAKLSAVRLKVGAGPRGVTLSGQVQVDESQVALAVLLEARRHDERYVPLGPGQWLRLDADLVQALDEVEPGVVLSQGGLRVPSVAQDAVARLVAVVPDPEVSPAWRALERRRQALRSFEPTLPEGLQADLREYQRESFVWMARLAHQGLGACLADEMGLGKTVQAIAQLVARAGQGPALVVAPTSVGHNWCRELSRFAPGLVAQLYRGPERQQNLQNLQAGTVLVTSYDIVVRDVERLAQVPFGTLIFDEAQALKNPSAQRTRAARRLQGAWRLALTGTPIENDVSDLFSILNVVSPGLLGPREGFKRRFSPVQDEAERARRMAQLSRLVRPFVLRRRKREVAKELPPRIEVRVDVELGPEACALYRAVQAASVREISEAVVPGLESQRRFMVLTALTRLRQLACHPQLYDRDSAVVSDKHQRLLELLKDLLEGGQRVLIFSQFVRQLDVLKATLERAGIAPIMLSGRTPPDTRARLVQAFQAGEASVFLISLKAGGTGLNLTAADAVIHLDPWWNPAVEDQASDRAHRIGRTQPVTIYRMVTLGTIEETIIDLQAEKRSTSEAVLGDAGKVAKLGTEQLIQLIGQGLSAEAPAG